MTVDWHTAVFAGAALLAIRVLEDYLVIPRVLGGAVGMSPLIVMISAIAVTKLFGGFYVLISVPIASLIVTVVDVVVRGVDPAEEEVPTVLFPAKEAEGK
jgi:predicted PurR-regulated permease PerM